MRLTKFGSKFRVGPSPDLRVEIIDPTKGMHAGFSPQELPPGYTPDSQNWTVSGGRLVPRSGLSRFDATYALGDAALGTFEALDLNGLRYAFGGSTGTLSALLPNATSWSNLSYVAGTPADVRPSGDWTIRWDAASIYEPARDKNIAVFTNGRSLPKFLDLTPSTTTYSDFTWARSALSRAVSVCAFDNRLVFFDVGGSSTSYPQRVVWSDRGAPLSYPATNFADLLDMAGQGVAIVPTQDGFVLFSDREIWQARRRNDVYAFDFYPVWRNFGCPYPRTILSTPLGIIFLGVDLEVYLLSGTQVLALGPVQPQVVGVPQAQNPSRIQSYLQTHISNPSLAWSAYDSANRSYCLFFATNDETFATDALYYHLNNGAWLHQTFPFKLSHGADIADVEQAGAWDTVPQAWDNYDVYWDQGSLSAAPRRLAVWSSDGTPYRFRSDQTSDDGTAIDARWRSHGLGQSDQFRYDNLFELGIEYAAPSTGTLYAYTSPDMGSTFGSAHTGSLSSTSAGNMMVPVYEVASAPLFEIRVADGSRPRVARLQARLRDAGQYGGAP